MSKTVTRTDGKATRETASRCRIAATAVLAGPQDMDVRKGASPAVEGEIVTLRIGTLLIYIEDAAALTALVEGLSAASLLGDKTFKATKTQDVRKLSAWRAIYRGSRAPVDESRAPADDTLKTIHNGRSRA